VSGECARLLRGSGVGEPSKGMQTNLQGWTWMLYQGEIVILLVGPGAPREAARGASFWKSGGKR